MLKVDSHEEAHGRSHETSLHLGWRQERSGDKRTIQRRSIAAQCLTVLMVPAIVVAVLGPAAPVFSQDLLIGSSFVPGKAAQERLDEMFYKWQTFSLDLGEMAESAREDGGFQLLLGDKPFELELTAVDLRAEKYKEHWNGAEGLSWTRKGSSPVGTYKGTVKGELGSDVRLLVLPDLLQGYIRTAEGWYIIDPLVAVSPSAGSAEIVFYEANDVRPSKRQQCGNEPAGRSLVSDAVQSTTGVVFKTSLPYTAELATEADYEYYQIFGANTNSQIAGIVNQVNGIFESEINLTIEISYQNAWTTSADPYVQTADTLARLNEFRGYWNANRAGVQRDVAHLFSGRSFPDAIGRAWLGVVCENPTYSYGISVNFALIVKVVAHELGHNFDAGHDNEFSPPAANCDGTGPLMCSFVQSSGLNVFSGQAKADMNAHLYGNDQCLEPGWCEAVSQCPFGGSVSCSGLDMCFSTGCGVWCDGSWGWCPGFGGQICF